MATTSPIPGSAAYGQEATLANNAYNAALAQINKNRMNTLTQYGYTGTIDPKSGVLSGVGVDPHAQYGQLQQMMHGHALEDRNAEWGAESRGLFGGLANQARSEAHYGHGADLTALGQNLTGSLDELQNLQQQAGESRDSALWQAEQEQLAAELQAEQTQTLDDLLNPPASVPVAGGGSGGGSPGTGGGTVAGHPGIYRRPREWTLPEGDQVLHSPRGLSAKAKAQHKVIGNKHRGNRGRQ